MKSSSSAIQRGSYKYYQFQDTKTKRDMSVVYVEKKALWAERPKNASKGLP